MSTIPVQGANTAAGTPGESETDYPSRPSTQRVVRSEQTFWHYISNNMDASYCKPGILDAKGVILADYGYHIIPYNNLGAAWSPANYEKLTFGAQRIKLLKMGYKVRHFNTLLEQVTARASSTFIENVFDSRPHALEWHDHEHVFDSGLSDELEPAHASELNQKQKFAQMNDNLSKADPTSLQGGLLARAYWLLQNNANQNFAPGEQLINVYDYANINARKDGEKWSHEWVNPGPVWMGVGRFSGLPWQAFTQDPDAHKSGFNKYGYWPRKRTDAISEYYFQNDPIWPIHGGIAAQGTPVAPPSVPGTIPAVNAITAPSMKAATCTPPYAYIKLNPLHGPTSPITMAAIMLITYFQEVLVEEPMWLYRQPWAGGQDNNWTKENYIHNQQGLYNQRTVVGHNTTLQGRKRKADVEDEYAMLELTE